MLKTPVAIASVQVTRTSMREVSFKETVRAFSCLVFSCGRAKLPQLESEKKKLLKPLMAKIKNLNGNTREEGGGIMDHDTMSMTVSPLFSMKI